MKLTYFFDMVRNRQWTEYDTNTINNLLTKPHKNIPLHSGIWLEIAKDAFKIVFIIKKKMFNSENTIGYISIINVLGNSNELDLFKSIPSKLLVIV